MIPKTTRLIFAACLLSLFALPAAALAIGPYVSSNIGYDVSYATYSYPATSFGFAIVSVTRGKAFTRNNRLASEFAWGRFGSGTAPTFYMNLNAPYGSTVAGHVDAPHTCKATTTIAISSGGATSTEPTACAGYNYGYNAAKDAFAYAKASDVSSSLWWLDIEEANSWSASTTVNAATIQGAVDYLNAKDIRVGVYSMARMWGDIVGAGFAPTQTLNGQQVTTPAWMPIGVSTQVAAQNACVLRKSFILNNPIWLIQYLPTATSIDRNVAC